MVMVNTSTDTSTGRGVVVGTQPYMKWAGKTVVIDRGKWYRGNGAAGARLLRGRGDDRMCCIGFLALQVCGLPADEIRGQAHLRAGALRDPLHALGVDIEQVDDAVWAAYSTNDKPDCTEEERERRITEILLRNLGVHVRFVDHAESANDGSAGA